MILQSFVIPRMIEPKGNHYGLEIRADKNSFNFHPSLW